MLRAQADLPPAIIHILQVLLDPTSYPPAHTAWVQDGVRATLANWEREEDLERLKRDLGLDLPKKRRKTLTMRQETGIAAAIVDAALAGESNPIKTVTERLGRKLGEQGDVARRVQRAWKTWRRVYLARLELRKPQVSPADRSKIRGAIKSLKPPGMKRRDRK
jgi:hypothetical protein